VLLGKTMKFFMQNDYPIPKRAFQDFVLFLERCKGYEEDAILTDVDANMSLLSVQINSTVAGRVDCEIPCEPIPGLHLVGGNVRQVG
jgi:hypothetical protein